MFDPGLWYVHACYMEKGYTLNFSRNCEIGHSRLLCSLYLLICLQLINKKTQILDGVFSTWCELHRINVDQFEP